MRAGPDGKAAILDRLDQPASVAVLRTDSAWALIRDPVTGREGWVQARRLTDREPAKASKPSAAAGLTTAAIAAILIRQSIASYPGPCGCPYQTDVVDAGAALARRMMAPAAIVCCAHPLMSRLLWCRLTGTIRMIERSEYERSSVSLPDAKRGQAIFESVSSSVAILTGGVSELFAPLAKRVVEKRVAEVREMLLRDLESGAIERAIVEWEDEFSSFIFRLHRAAIEGCAKYKLRLMYRYFFRRYTAADYREDMFLTFSGIVEQLSDHEIRAIAVIKREIAEGRLVKMPSQVKEDDPPDTRVIRIDIDPQGLFGSTREFLSQLPSLMRFGLLEAASAWGSLAYIVTDKGFDFFEQIDLAGVDFRRQLTIPQPFS